MNIAEENKIKDLIDEAIKVADSASSTFRLYNLKLLVDKYIGQKMEIESARAREKGIKENEA